MRAPSREALSIVLTLALPGDDKVARPVHGNDRFFLVTRGRGIHQELYTLCHTTAVVPLGINTFFVAVLVRAFPGDHEVTRIVDTHDWRLLIASGCGVYLEFTADCDTIGIIHLREHTFLAVDVVLARTLPDNNHDTRRVHGCCGFALVTDGGGIADNLNTIAGRLANGDRAINRC